MKYITLRGACDLLRSRGYNVSTQTLKIAAMNKELKADKLGDNTSPYVTTPAYVLAWATSHKWHKTKEPSE